MMKKFEKVIDSSHNQKKILLDVRFVENHIKKPVVIFVHGFKGFKDWGHFNLVANYFANNGFVYVKLNFSHNGTTPEYPVDFVDLEAFGNNNFTKELDDLGNVIDYIFSDESGIPPGEISLKNLYLIGHSRGGGAVILKANEDARVKGIAAWASVDTLSFRTDEVGLAQWKAEGVQYVYNGRTKQNMPLYYQIAEDFLQNESRFNIEKAMKNICRSMIAFHGANDEAVPLSAAENLHRWNPAVRLEIVKNANHTFGGKHPYEEGVLPVNSQFIVEKTVQFFNAICGA